MCGNYRRMCADNSLVADPCTRSDGAWNPRLPAGSLLLLRFAADFFQVGTLVGLQLGSFIYFTLFFSGFPAILAYLFFLSLFLFSSSILGIEAVATMVSHGGGMLKRSPCAKFSTNSQWVRGEFGACCG